MSELKDKVLRFVSAVQTINVGKRHEIMVDGDDEPQYTQRKEWVEYILDLAKELEHEAKK